MENLVSIIGEGINCRFEDDEVCTKRDWGRKRKEPWSAFH